MAFSNIRMTGAWAFRSTPFISFSIFFAVAWRHHLNFSIRKICNIHKCINGVLLKKFRMKSPHLRIILKPYVTILPKINIWNPRLQSSKRVILSHVRTMANYHNTTNVSNHLRYPDTPEEVRITYPIRIGYRYVADTRRIHIGEVSIKK